MKTSEQAAAAVEKYSDTVWRVCLIELKNKQDAEDIFQTVFLKYILYSGEFESEEHERAWFIRVTINACRDLFRSFFRKNTVSLELAEALPAPEAESGGDLTAAVMALPEKYKIPVYLFYYERLTAPEIGKILGRGENTIYTRLSRARTMLKETLGGDFLEV